jgi:anti-sigma regulatory factor (Ser/Thr protein kinase)
MSTTAEPALDRFTHPALFYRGEAEYLAATVPFVLDGLAAGDPVAVSVPGWNLEPLRAALGSDAARVRMMDMTRAGRNPGRILAGVLHTAADAHPDRHVRIIGEPIWPGRTDLEYPACGHHEALINLSFAGRDVTILCPYDADNLDPAILADAATTHPVLIEGGHQRPSRTYDARAAIARFTPPLPEPPSCVKLRFDGDVLRELRRFSHEQAVRAGLAGDRLEDFVLAVNELATNSIEHGGGTGVLRIWTEDGQLAGEVRDSGRLTDPLVGRRPATSEHSRRGRGLLMVHQLADLVRSHTGSDGTTIRIYLRP